MTKSAGLGVHSLQFRDCTAYEAGRGPLEPGEDQIDQFGRHLCGIAEGWGDIILVIPSGRSGETLPENRREAGSRQYVRQKP
jgi:hypothetical protein